MAIKHCKKCNYYSSMADSSFCSMCGGTMTEGKRDCEKCGKSIFLSDPFCQHCGVAQKKAHDFRQQ
jgi:predicted amidophosphoribosyltransferase